MKNLSFVLPVALFVAAGSIAPQAKADRLAAGEQFTTSQFLCTVLEDNETCNMRQLNGLYENDITTLTMPTYVTYDGYQYKIVAWGLNGEYGLKGAKKLVTLNSEPGCTFIGGWCINDMPKLTTVNLPSTLVELSNWAVSLNPELKEITIPATVTKMGNGAIGNNAGLKVITFEGTVPPEFTGEAGYPPVYGDAALTKIVVPAEAKEAYKACSWLSTVTDIIVAPGEEVGPSEFTTGDYYYKILPDNEAGVYGFAEGVTSTVVNIPATTTYNGVTYTVTQLMPACFQNKGITEVNLPEGLKVIGTNAFSQDPITTITIPGTVEEIGNNAFQKCKSLTELIIPASVKKLGAVLCSGCTALTKVKFNGQTIVPNQAFDGCKALVDFDFAGLVNIEPYAFRSCSGLTTINLPETIESVGSNAFSDCSGVTTLTLPQKENVTYNTYCFEGLRTLPTINVPPVKECPGFMFAKCNAATTATIPAVVEKIPGMFRQCYALTTITCLGKVPAEANNYTFDDGYGTTLKITVKVPAGAGEAYKNADYWKNLTIEEEAVTGMDVINNDAVKAEYYDLMGRRVNEPVNGNLYIRVQGSKAQKVVL